MLVLKFRLTQYKTICLKTFYKISVQSNNQIKKYVKKYKTK